MKYVLAFVPSVALIIYHDAWGSVECPVLLCLSALACAIIKTKSNEQGKKKGTGEGN